MWMFLCFTDLPDHRAAIIDKLRQHHRHVVVDGGGVIRPLSGVSDKCSQSKDSCTPHLQSHKPDKELVYLSFRENLAVMTLMNSRPSSVFSLWKSNICSPKSHKNALMTIETSGWKYSRSLQFNFPAQRESETQRSLVLKPLCATLTLLSLLQWVSQREGGVATRIDLTALFGGPRPSTVNRVNIFMLLFFWHMEKNMHKRQ